MIKNLVRQLVHGFSKIAINDFPVRDRLDGCGVHYRDFHSLYYINGEQLAKTKRIIKKSNKQAEYKKDII